MSNKILKAIGVLVCLFGAALMVWGDPILGESHTGVATVVGMIGLGIITTSNRYAHTTRENEGM